MFPQKIEYPRFVPDQLLTSEHLNQLFEYLEEQGRLTRTNLIGIGIYCGGEVKTADDGTSITITKLCGVTSEGYLVSMPEVMYTRYKTFNAVKERLYDRFVDLNTKQQKYTLYELMQESVEEGTFPLTEDLLEDKVVLIFVELLEEGNKNCNPDSCDDKGINVTVNFRPLLISITNAAKLVTDGLEDPAAPKTIDYYDLPELRMRRWDVPATNILDTADLFIAYRQILNKTFITKAETTLSSVYTLLKPLIADQFPDNPFLGLSTQFALLYKNTIGTDELVQLQYYYDLFSDLLLAYDELRRKGMEMISQCCPDSSLFPRHLLLGEAIPVSQDPSSYRNYFIPSPVLCCEHRHLLSGIKELFRRLTLIINQFTIPPVLKVSKGDDAAIRITPSKYGDHTLSEKAIPFYYKVKNGPFHLYRYWSMEQNITRSPQRILSYHAAQYNATDEFVTQPLLYDLEPYNFLRIEGHVGKPYQHVLKNILQLKHKHRLPIDVIALSADVRVSKTAADGKNAKCHFQDLESLYDALIAELKCNLCKQMKYYYNVRNNATFPFPANRKPTTSLLLSCDPAFLFTANTIGHEFEIFYQPIRSYGYIRPQQFFSSGTGIPGFPPTGGFNEMIRYVMLVLIYYIEELSKTLPANLSTFDHATFSMRFDDLQLIANYLRAVLRMSVDLYLTPLEKEDIIDHVDELLLSCKQSQFKSIITDYLNRLHYANLLRKFGYFIKKHPGVQHKAGVPVGGTFILVYHEKEEQPGTVNTPPIFVPTTSFTFNPSFIPNATVGNASFVAPGSNSRAAAAPEDTPVTAAAALADPPVSIVVDEIEKEFEEILKGKIPNLYLEGLIEDIPDGTVVADFYLPYICCSDCPPIQYILNEVTEKLTVSLPEDAFCRNDESSYPFTVSPLGGAVTVGEEGGDSVSVDESGNYTFNPIQVPMDDVLSSKELTFVYTKDGNSAVCKATVYRQPEVSFINTPGSSALEVQFTAVTNAGDEFLWTFGDNTTSTEQNPLHTYGTFGNYVVTLEVSNGPCSNTTSRDVLVQQVAMAIPPNEFCANDQSSYPFVVTPLGGTVTSPAGETNNGVSTNPDGTIVFIPASALLPVDAPTRVLTFTYTVPGQVITATAQATVYRPPVAEFQATVENTPVTFKFNNQSSAYADGFKWNFGDGETADERDPVHTYKEQKENKDYEVKLRVSHGPCESTTTQIISVIIGGEKVCLPLGELLARFATFETSKAPLFIAFKNNYQSYDEVSNFFANLSAADVRDNPAEQRELFVRARITDALRRWLDELFKMITTSNDLETPAVVLFRMLADLSMYIACLQPDDIDKTLDPPLKVVFDLIIERLPGITKETVERNRLELQTLLATLNVELQRLTDNEENKPAYKEVLTKLIEILGKLLA